MIGDNNEMTHKMMNQTNVPAYEEIGKFHNDMFKYLFIVDTDHDRSNCFIYNTNTFCTILDGFKLAIKIFWLANVPFY